MSLKVVKKKAGGRLSRLDLECSVLLPSAGVESTYWWEGKVRLFITS